MIFKQKSFILFLLIFNRFDYRKSQKAEEYLRTTCTTCDTKIYKDIMSGVAPTSNQERSRINTTLSYNKELRPAGEPEQGFFTTEGAVIVGSIFSLKQIVSFDEKNQVLTTNFYLLLTWFDPRCSWNSAKYGSTFIVAPALSFWLPDLAILNAASGESLIKYSTTQTVLISKDGQIFLTLGFPSQATKCKLNVYNYPFDTQKCSIKIGS